MPIFERVNEKLSFAYSKRESVISIEIEITDKWIFYSGPRKCCDAVQIAEPEVLSKDDKNYSENKTKLLKVSLVPVLEAFRQKEIIYLFKKTAVALWPGRKGSFMTWVIKKVKLGIIKQYK